MAGSGKPARMNYTALFFAVICAVIALVYAFEAFLFYVANGVELPLLVKAGISAAGIYFFGRNVRRFRQSPEAPAPGKD